MDCVNKKKRQAKQEQSYGAMTDVRYGVGPEDAEMLDKQNPLAKYRKRFYCPNGKIYMDGNSLGLCSDSAEACIKRAVDEWKNLAVGGWWDGKPPWFHIAEHLGALCAPLVGAEADEVVATGTTTVNIHALLSTFYKPDHQRYKIIADVLDFPSDIYALKSQILMRGLDPEKALFRVRSRDGRTINEEDIIEAMKNDVALVHLPSVLYRSGQLLDMPYLTKEAHRRGIVIGFDCCHSVGTVPHNFDEWDVDYALWCGYKYINGGPGSPAFLYVNRKHFKKGPALWGWFGNRKDTQFLMSHDFEPAENAGAWQISSPPILSCAPLEGSIEIIREAGIETIRSESLKMTDYLIYLVDELLSDKPYCFSIGTPRKHCRRGGAVAVEHNAAERICNVLIARGIVPDFRHPNVIRVAPVPLYNTYQEIWKVAYALRDIIDKGEHTGP